MATLRDSYNTGDDNSLAVINTAWKGQTFLTTAAYTITSVKLKLLRVGSPGNFTVQIQNVVASKPGGTILCSGTYDGNTLGTAAAGVWVEIIFTVPASLADATSYGIVIPGTGMDGSNSIKWRNDSSTGYADGALQQSIDQGSSWQAPGATNDVMFEIWSETASGSVKTHSVKLVAACNNEIWYESSAGTMEELTAANGDINTTEPVSMVDAYEKVFIANGTNFKVADFGNTKIITANVGSHPPDFGTILTGDTSQAKMVVDYITALSSACTIYGKRITAATFTASETISGYDDDDNEIDFNMTAANEVAPPHWYDWTVFGDDSGSGVMPDKAYDVCLYRGRLGLTRNIDYPFQWYLSKQGNPWNWLYAATDARSAVAGGNSDVGKIGDVVIGQIPYKDDYLVYGCATSLWYLLGDPMMGGSLIELDLTQGLLAPNAFCWDNNSNLYMVTTAGLVRIPRGFGQIENLTLIDYPDFINDLAYDPTLHSLTLAFDKDDRGVLVTKTVLLTGVNVNYWYDLRTEGLFYDVYPDDAGVRSVLDYKATDPDYRNLLFGCDDGYIRWFDPDSTDDDTVSSTEAIDSYITFGPLPMSDDMKHEGKLIDLDFITAGGAASGSQSDSNDIYYRVFTAKSAEEIIEKLYADSGYRIAGTITAPGRRRGSSIKKKIRGVFMGVKLGNETAAETWAFEKMLYNIKKVGRLK